jgi:hypothetical protein
MVERSSMPADLDVFRLADLTTVIVATARVVNVLAELGLKGFRAVDLAQSP